MPMTMSKTPNWPAVSVPIMTQRAPRPVVQSFMRPVSATMLPMRWNMGPSPPAPPPPPPSEKGSLRSGTLSFWLKKESDLPAPGAHEVLASFISVPKLSAGFVQLRILPRGLLNLYAAHSVGGVEVVTCNASVVVPASAGVLNDGEWHQIALLVDADNHDDGVISFVVNGHVKQASCYHPPLVKMENVAQFSFMTGFGGVPLGSLVVGAVSHIDSTNAADALFDDVSFYQRILSQSELNALASKVPCAVGFSGDGYLHMPNTEEMTGSERVKVNLGKCSPGGVYSVSYHFVESTGHNNQLEVGVGDGRGAEEQELVAFREREKTMDKNNYVWRWTPPVPVKLPEAESDERSVTLSRKGSVEEIMHDGDLPRHYREAGPTLDLIKVRRGASMVRDDLLAKGDWEQAFVSIEAPPSRAEKFDQAFCKGTAVGTSAELLAASANVVCGYGSIDIDGPVAEQAAATGEPSSEEGATGRRRRALLEETSTRMVSKRDDTFTRVVVELVVGYSADWDFRFASGGFAGRVEIYQGKPEDLDAEAVAKDGDGGDDDDAKEQRGSSASRSHMKLVVSKDMPHGKQTTEVAQHLASGHYSIVLFSASTDDDMSDPLSIEFKEPCKCNFTEWEPLTTGLMECETPVKAPEGCPADPSEPSSPKAAGKAALGKKGKGKPVAGGVASAALGLLPRNAKILPSIDADEEVTLKPFMGGTSSHVGEEEEKKDDDEVPLTHQVDVAGSRHLLKKGEWDNDIEDATFASQGLGFDGVFFSMNLGLSFDGLSMMDLFDPMGAMDKIIAQNYFSFAGSINVFFDSVSVAFSIMMGTRSEPDEGGELGHAGLSALFSYGWGIPKLMWPPQLSEELRMVEVIGAIDFSDISLWSVLAFQVKGYLSLTFKPGPLNAFLWVMQYVIIAFFKTDLVQFFVDMFGGMQRAVDDAFNHAQQRRRDYDANKCEQTCVFGICVGCFKSDKEKKQEEQAEYTKRADTWKHKIDKLSESCDHPCYISQENIDGLIRTKAVPEGCNTAFNRINNAELRDAYHNYNSAVHKVHEAWHWLKDNAWWSWIGDAIGAILNGAWYILLLLAELWLAVCRAVMNVVMELFAGFLQAIHLVEKRDGFWRICESCFQEWIQDAQPIVVSDIAINCEFVGFDTRYWVSVGVLVFDNAVEVKDFEFMDIPTFFAYLWDKFKALMMAWFSQFPGSGWLVEASFGVIESVFGAGAGAASAAAGARKLSSELPATSSDNVVGELQDGRVAHSGDALSPAPHASDAVHHAEIGRASCRERV